MSDPATSHQPQSQPKPRQHVPAGSWVFVGALLFVAGVVTGGALSSIGMWATSLALPPDEVALPLAAVPLTDTPARPFTANPPETFITVDAQGDLQFEGVRRTKEELREALAARANANPGQLQVIIRVHPSAEFQHAVELMELCQRLKIFDYRIASLESDE